MIHLQTERLVIRDIEETDVVGIFALDSDPEVLRFIGTPVITHRSEAGSVVSEALRKVQVMPGCVHCLSDRSK